MKKTGIVWFTSDLRIEDNETLSRAIDENDFVIPLYCWDEEFFESKHNNFPRVGFHRQRFILNAIIDLHNSLKSIGGVLFVRHGKAINIFKEITQKNNIQKVYTKKQVGFEEKTLNEELKNYLFSVGVDFQEYSTSTLYHPSDLPFSMSTIPTVFSKFRKLTEKESTVRLPLRKPNAILCPKEKNDFPPKLKFKNSYDLLSPSLPVLGGEKYALEHLKRYLFESKSILHYKKTRNELFGLEFSSKLSPWLALGCLSPKFIYHQIKAFEREFHANESTYWLVFEILWRDFFRFCFKKHPTEYFKKHGIIGSSSNKNQINIEIINDWINGNTQNQFVNASMNELKSTGWTSNRMRQIVASYFIHDLKQDWRIGASYFEYILIDYDVSSNWGNWAYIAGVGNDPRAGRKFNLEKQEDLYDKEKRYQTIWLSQLKSRHDL